MLNREAIKQKFGGKCAYSGTVLEDDWQVDHLWPKAAGGTNDIDNLVPCQKIINHYKRGLPIDLFRTWFLAGLHDRLKKLPKNPKAAKSIKRKKYLLKVASYFDITPEKPFSGTFYFEQYGQQRQRKSVPL